jgi:hypothetical protein
MPPFPGSLGCRHAMDRLDPWNETWTRLGCCEVADVRNMTGRPRPVTRFIVGLLAWTATLLVAATEARADGNSLIGYPQANIIDENAFHLDVDTVGVKASTNSFTGIGVTYGLGSLLGRAKSTAGKDGLFGRAEVGVDYLMSAGGSVPNVPSKDRFYFNFKVQLYNDDASKTQIVSGGYNLGSQSLATPRELYILVARVHSWGKLQIGVTHAFGPEEGLITPAGHAERNYIQVSFNRHLAGRLYGAFAGYTGLSTQSRGSVAVAYYLDQTYKASFALGLLRYNDHSVLPGQYQTYFGFDYDWGGKGK